MTFNTGNSFPENRVTAALLLGRGPSARPSRSSGGPRRRRAAGGGQQQFSCCCSCSCCSFLFRLRRLIVARPLIGQCGSKEGRTIDRRIPSQAPPNRASETKSFGRSVAAAGRRAERSAHPFLKESARRPDPNSQDRASSRSRSGPLFQTAIQSLLAWTHSVRRRRSSSVERVADAAGNKQPQLAAGGLQRRERVLVTPRCRLKLRFLFRLQKLIQGAPRGP